MPHRDTIGVTGDRNYATKAISAKDRKKYGITATTDGYPELYLAMHKAKETLGWKGLTSALVGFTNEHQPEDTAYTLEYWLNESRDINGDIKYAHIKQKPKQRKRPFNPLNL